MANPDNKASKGGGVKIVADNRQARYQYEILDTYEAGVVLTGTEVKSIREGKVNLARWVCQRQTRRSLATQRAYFASQHDQPSLQPRASPGA